MQGEEWQDDPDDRIALRAWNLLSNGNAAIDWAGLDFVAGLLGIDDIEALLGRFAVIKGYRKPEED